ncbi:thiamine phosphate synthase [Rhizobium daejeonense]|uniref:Thiamine-phosphate synthase n=1 Tax=Rhizobium daejeonense TaxID=240521 RepID=A0A6M1S3K7_9HYPH|nr:thiamine phosphate synthase [Rhizobium daejeonense]NGO64821.1 thiamine phosphate synthase [Rhizobium daejeonense]
MKNVDLSLYLVLDPVLCEPIGMVETARLAVAGGATLVQLRDKKATTHKMIETGRALKAALAGSGVPLIVNDDVEAAIAIGADGVHVGQNDMPVAEVRRLIGPNMILGLSIGSVELANALDPSVVDHVGVGPVFPTSTKPGHPPAIGFEGLAAVTAASPVPVVGIGGLKLQHVVDTLATGAAGLAVVSAICGQPDPASATMELAGAIRRARR